jgi:outer membrane protein OmpA-like peptidoglycan-associated protein
VSAAVNERLSKERAESVARFLAMQGISTLRLTTEGKSFNEPVADNSTATGRAQNRRVEVFITANATIIQQAEQGTLR